MSLMKESRNSATIRVTDQVWSTLQDHRIAFRKLDRKVVRAIVLDKSAVVEEYTTVSTTRLQTMGAHSYLMDNVVFESVGRYCSIADGVAVRWSPPIGQFGGFAKLGSGSPQAANLLFSPLRATPAA